MTKLLLCIVGGIALYFAGWFTSLKVNIDSVESAQFKRELIDAQNAALETAEIVMDNNDLWDIDGSDDMSEYLYYSYKVDSLYNTQL